MKTNSIMVKQVLMSILTAGIFSFSFTACSDDLNESGNTNANFSQTRGDYSEYEPYGLTYHNFDGADDVQILNADTTEIAIKKSLADKLGITNFTNHPLGIWDAVNHLPYGRKAVKQELLGDRYILQVTTASVAELLGNKKVQLNTQAYVNQNAQSVKTRATGDNIPEFAAKYIDEDNVIHPAAVLLTDPLGYDKGYHLNSDKPVASQTRAAQSGEYQYMTAEEMVGSQTRWSSSHRILSFHNEVKIDEDFEVTEDGDSININATFPIDFELNYFITIEGGIKWSGILPKPCLEKFEGGLNGEFGFHPEIKLGFKQKLELPEEKQKHTLISFDGYSFTFMVGVVPVLIKVDPALYAKFDASIEGSIEVGFKYDYSCEFQAGARWTDSKGWQNLSYFKEIENKLEPIYPQFTFKAEAGAALYLGAEVMIYGVAGPEIGIGPKIGGELELTLSTKDDPTFNAELKMGLEAVAGAKLKILGYELADWSITFPIAGPWTLFKFPSDGSEHVVGSENELPYTFTKLFGDTEKSQWGGIFTKNLNEAIKLIKEMQNISSDEEARKFVLNAISNRYKEDEVNRNVMGTGKWSDAYLYGVAEEMANYYQEQLQKYNDYKLQKAVENGDTKYIIAENWKRISQSLLSNVKLNTSGDKESAMNDIHQWFLDEFKREPKENSAEDMAWLTDRIRNYVHYKNATMFLDLNQIREMANHLVSSHPGYTELLETTRYDLAKEAIDTFAKTYHFNPTKDDARLHEIFVKLVEKKIADKKAEQTKKEEDKKNGADAWSQILTKLQNKYSDVYKKQARNFSKFAGKAHNSFKKKYGRDVTTSDADFQAVCELFESFMNGR
jgi:hypothetical protein